MIKEEDGKFCVYAADGTKVGEYDTREAAEAKLASLREAYSPDSLDGRASRIRTAYSEYVGYEPGPQNTWVEEVFDSYLVVCKAGKYFRVPYTAEGETFSFGAAEAVEIEYVTSMAAAEKSAGGSTWEVEVIRAGFSHNRMNGLPMYYPVGVIESATPLVEGARVYAHSASPTLSDEHEEPSRASPRDVVGWLDNVRMVGEAMRAELHVTATWLREALVEAWEKGKRDLYGLSITGQGPVKRGEAAGKPATLVEAIKRIFFVTLCTRPAAGGRFVSLIESTQTQEREGADMDRKKVLAAIRNARPELLANLNEAELTDERVEALLTEAMKSAPKSNGGAADATLTEAQKVLKEAQTEVAAAKKERCAMLLESKMIAAKLPEPIAFKLSKRFAGRTFETAELDEAIKEEKETLDKLTESGAVRIEGQARVEVTKDQRDKWGEGMDNMLSHDPNKHRKGFRSLRESYRTIAGRIDMVDSEWAHRVLFEAICHAPRISDKWEDMPKLIESLGLRESLKTSDWGEIFNVSMYKQLIAAYDTEDYNKWRDLVSNYGSLSNFQTVRRVRYGGYGLLPTVTEQGTYQPLTSPGNEAATYAPSKRGGLEDLTWEMFLGDDLGAVRDVPKRLGLAAIITLYNEMLDFLRTNPNIYDGFALFDAANHGGNTATGAALSAPNLKALIQVMRDQTAFGNSTQVLGGVNAPYRLWVPNELDDIAFKLTTSAVDVGAASEAGTTPNLITARYSQLKPVVIDDFTDANDWFATADPKKMPLIEVGFLNGNQEPELFVQDLPNVGSMFNADKVTYKIRHVHGKAPLDWRGFQRRQG